MRAVTALLLLVLCAPFVLLSQRRTDSPAFRQYKPPEELPLLPQGNPVYQSWQVFLAMRKANSGDPVAQQELALRLFTGTGVPADTVQAAYWMKRAADQGVMQARFNIALFYYNGWGVQWDPFESYRNFRVCAEKDVAEAAYAVGIFCIENLIMPENWEQGHRWIKLAADRGYQPAKEILPRFEQRLAAMAADTGRPIFPGMAAVISPADTAPPDAGLAALRDALLSAEPETRRALGLGVESREDVRADSIDLPAITVAADWGSPEALALLGRCYEDGIGVARDRVTAAAFYLRAARMESVRGAQQLWAFVESSGGIAEVKARAERNDPVAQFVWAGLLSFGFEPQLLREKSYITSQQAVTLLRNASAGGYAPSTIELGLLYYSGRWVNTDEKRALELWKDAEKQGSREASVRLATVTVRGDTNPSGLEHALAVLRESSESGAVLAEVALGYCYERGIGLERSDRLASTLYRSAWRRGSQDAYRALRRMHDALRPPDPLFAMPD